MAASMWKDIPSRVSKNIHYLGKKCALNNQSSSLICKHLSSESSVIRKESEQEAEIEDEFRTYVIPGTEPDKRRPGFQRKQRSTRPMRPEVPRYTKMRPDQDWTNVWPAAHTFKWSAIPFPVRQGFIKRISENEGIPPGRYANAELMKLPNFLHLTTGHIKKHCAALKEFCTAWPEGLETDEQCEKHFPIQSVTSDYSHAGPSVRDFRSRGVKLKFKLSSLDLDYHAHDKMIRLVGDRYDKETDTVTIVTDRCPLKKQNYDYSIYLLTALYFESCKVEPWEAEKTEADMEVYTWNITKSRTSLLKLVNNLQKRDTIDKDTSSRAPEYLSQLPEAPSEEDIVNLAVTKEYRRAVSDLHNVGEENDIIKKYKQSVLKLLDIPDNGIPTMVK